MMKTLIKVILLIPFMAGASSVFAHVLLEGYDNVLLNTPIYGSPVSFKDGTVVIAEESGLVHWLKNGKILYSLQLLGRVGSSPTITSDGAIVVPSIKKEIFWIK